MQQPTLSFLFGVKNLPSLPLPRQSQQQKEQEALYSPESFAGAAAGMFQQLAGIDPRLLNEPTSSSLLSAVLALAPGLPGLLVLAQQLQPLLQQAAARRSQGNLLYSSPAARTISNAAMAAIREASLPVLIRSWACLTAQEQQHTFRQPMQDAVTAALLKQPSMMDPAQPRNPGDPVDWELLRDQLLFGDLFDGGPGQLLQALCSSSNASCRWSPFVSYVLVPAALQQLLAAASSRQQLEQPSGPEAAAAATEASSIQQQQQQQEQEVEGPLTDVTSLQQVVCAWLLHQPVAGPGGATPLTTTSSKVSPAYLYCAAEQLLQNCAAGLLIPLALQDAAAVPDGATALGERASGLEGCKQPIGTPQANPELQEQLQEEQLQQAAPTEQQAQPGSSSSSSSLSQDLLGLVLHVLREATEAALQQEQLLLVLQAARELLAFGCSQLLQQHFLRTVQQCFAPAAMTPTAGILHTSSEGGAAVRAATCDSLAMRQRVGQSWQAADVFVSAVLGCAAGDHGSSSFKATGYGGGATALQAQEPPPSEAPGGKWQAVSRKRQRQHHAQQPAQAQHGSSAAAAWLQQELLLLLADCLLVDSGSHASSCSTGLEAPSAYVATAAAAAASPSCSPAAAAMPLLQGTQDLISGHPLWLKLLHGLRPAQHSSPPDDAFFPNSSSRAVSRGTEAPHPVLLQVISTLAGLCSQVYAGSIAVSACQELQQDSDIVLQLVTAAECYLETACPAAMELISTAAAAAAVVAPLAEASNSSMSSHLSSAALQASLAAAEARLQQHREQQLLLEVFYTNLCPTVGATADLSTHVADLNRLAASLGSSLVAELCTPSVWGMHWAPLQAAAQVEGLMQLTPFINSCKQFAAAEAAASTASASAAEAAEGVASAGMCTESPQHQGSSSGDIGTAGTRARTAAGGSAAVAAVGVRDLNPSSCQLLRLLVHAALLLGSAAGLQPPGSLRRLLGAADDESAQGTVEQVLVQQLQLLLVSCHATEDQLLAMVHTAIQALSALQMGTSGGTSSSSWGGGQHFAQHLVSDSDRRAWERQFQEQIAKPVMACPARTLQQLLDGSRPSGTDPAAAAAGGGGEGAAAAQQYVQFAVEEGLDVAVDDSYRSAHLPALFRRIIQPSLDALAAHYWADPSNAQRYPVTLAVLQELQQQRLQLLPHLSTLTGFEAAFRARWSGTLSRSEAASLPLLTLLESSSAMQPGSSASCSTAVTVAAAGAAASHQVSVEAGRQFLAAWNAVVGITTRHECREVQVPTLKPQVAPAAMACASSQDDGRLLAALLAELAGRQNAFLAVAAGQQQQATVGSNQQLPLQHEAGLSFKPVQLTQPGDVVDVPAALQQLQELLACPGSQLAWPGLEYGTGRSLTFDLAAVESLLHSKLVQGKCLLDASTSSLKEFAFSGEAFLADFTLLHQVGLKVPQQDMPAEEAAELAASLLQQLQVLGITPASLLPQLEVLLSFVRKTGASPSSTVGEYAAAWLPDGTCRQQLMACQVLQQLPLRQLVAVYEAVEDAVAGTARIEDSISSCYSQPLTPQLRQQVFEMTGLSHSSSARQPQGRAAVPAAAVVTVLRRLMLRFLWHSAAAGAEQQGGTRPEVPLSVYCCNAACCRWPWQQFAGSSEAAEALLDDLFPAGLLLAHTASVVRLLR